jgi:hypothetical protein
MAALHNPSKDLSSNARRAVSRAMQAAPSGIAIEPRILTS